MILDLKSQLSSQFEMKDLGATRYIMGIETKRYRANIRLWLSQRKYVNSVMERFNMTTCKYMVFIVVQVVHISMEDCLKFHTEMEDITRVPYVSFVVNLMYTMVYMRLDIVQQVGVLSYFMATLGQVHQDILMRVFMYLRDTTKNVLYFHGYPSRPQNLVRIPRYVYLDWVSDIEKKILST